jgi:hypothetical protein
MRLNYHDYYKPCHDVVFSVMFADKHLFCRLCSATVGKDIHGMDETGRRLVSMYNTVVNNVANLQGIENTPYYAGRLSEAEIAEAVNEVRNELRDEVRREVRNEVRSELRNEVRREFAVSLFGILDDEIIAEKSGLSLEELQQLKR